MVEEGERGREEGMGKEGGRGGRNGEGPSI